MYMHMYIRMYMYIIYTSHCSFVSQGLAVALVVALSVVLYVALGVALALPLIIYSKNKYIL